MGQTVQSKVELQWISDGVSGFIIEVVVQDTLKARISSVSLPPYGIGFVNGVPGSSATLLVADLNDVLVGAFSSAVLATLDLELLSPGTTQLTLNLILLDNDSAESLISVTVLNSGSLTVN